MSYLIPADEFITEGEARHDSSLLQPEYGGKRSREEDSLDGSKGHHTLPVARILVIDPPDGPVSLLLHTWHSLNSIKQEIPENIFR